MSALANQRLADWMEVELNEIADLMAGRPQVNADPVLYGVLKRVHVLRCQKFDFKAELTPRLAAALKACPFCGSDEVAFVADKGKSEQGAINCAQCATEGPWGTVYEEVVTKWNKRAAYEAEPAPEPRFQVGQRVMHKNMPPGALLGTICTAYHTNGKDPWKQGVHWDTGDKMIWERSCDLEPVPDTPKEEL